MGGGGGGDQIRRSGQSGGDHNLGGTVDGRFFI